MVVACQIKIRSSVKLEGAWYEGGLVSLVLSYWERRKIDRNRPGLLRSELRSRRTLIVEQTNP